MPAEENIKNQESFLKEEEQGVKSVEVLFSWAAPARPFKRRNREFYITLIAMAALVSLILFFTEGAMPVILIISLIFLFYILNTVEPDIIEYKITNKGINIAGKITPWGVVNRFWFSRRFDSSLLIFETISLPGRLELVVNEAEKENLRLVITKYALEEEAPPSFLDKAANWFAKRLPQN